MNLDIKEPILNMLKLNLMVKLNDKILLITDDANKNTISLAKEVYDIIKENHKIDFHMYKSTNAHGAEPDEKTAELMKKYDVIIMLNYYSLTHTKAREEANKNSKIASMPGFTREMFYVNGPMAQNNEEIKNRTIKLNNILSKSKKATIKSENGTNLNLKLGRIAKPDSGFIEKGKCENLPAGESFTSPTNANGKLVINPNWHENLNEKLIFIIDNSKITKIEAFDEEGNKIKEDLMKFDHRRAVAELGIGTNPGAKNPSNTLEAEKILGTIHIAFGDSSHFGGNNVSDRHIDFILNNPTLMLDDNLIIEKGKFLLN